MKVEDRMHLDQLRRLDADLLLTLDALQGMQVLRHRAVGQGGDGDRTHAEAIEIRALRGDMRRRHGRLGDGRRRPVEG
jgi:hypothetical protein